MSAHVFHYINEKLNGRFPTYIHGSIDPYALIGLIEIMQELGLFKIGRFVKCNIHTYKLAQFVFIQLQDASHWEDNLKEV